MSSSEAPHTISEFRLGPNFQGNGFLPPISLEGSDVRFGPETDNALVVRTAEVWAAQARRRHLYVAVVLDMVCLPQLPWTGGDANRADVLWATSRTERSREGANLRPSLELESSPGLGD